MIDEILCKIPREKIKRIALYRNPVIHGSRKTLKQIVEETGADYAINGTLFNLRDGEAVCPLKISGVVDCADNYTYYGYSWDTIDNMEMRGVPDSARNNYIACVAMRHPDIGNFSPLLLGPELYGKRGRSAIGLNDDELILYACYDAGNARKTPTELQLFMEKAGATSSIMLDGGGSTQMIAPEGCITSSRRVPHCFLVFLKKDAQKELDEDIKEAHEVLDLTKYVSAVLRIAAAEDVAWDVALDMFVSNVQTYAAEWAAPYYGDAEVDLQPVADIWCAMTLQERAAAKNAFSKWYRAQLKTKGLL